MFQEATEGVAAAQTAAAKDTRKKGMRMRRTEEDEVLLRLSRVSFTHALSHTRTLSLTLLNTLSLLLLLSLSPSLNHSLSLFLALAL